MKGLIVKILIVVLLVVCFGGGVWQTINYIEDRIIAATVDLVENSEFVAEVRAMVQDVARDVIHDLLSQGYHIVLDDGTVANTAK